MGNCCAIRVDFYRQVPSLFSFRNQDRKEVKTMLSDTLYYILASNLERYDGEHALTERGLSFSYKGKKEWGFVPIRNQLHWVEVYMMLVEAVDTEKHEALDRNLHRIESPPLALG
jgi:hypothetical protein